MKSSRDSLEVAGLEIYEYRNLVTIWEEALRQSPDDPRVLAWLGHAYTRLGRIEEGLEIDYRLTGLFPGDAIARYNLCCSLSLLERTDQAFEELEKAIDLGYREVDQMRLDPDLVALRADPRFEEIVKRIG